MTRSTVLRILVLVLLTLCATAGNAEFRLEKRLDLAPGGQLVLDTDGGRIAVRGGSTEGVRVLITSPKTNIEDRYRFTFDAEDGRVLIKADRKGLSWFNWSSDSLRFEVVVPTETSIDLETSGGRIDVEGLQGTALLDTSGGRIEIQEIRGDVDAHTSGGPIFAEDIVGNLRADTSGGSISIERVSGDVHASTSGGSVALEEIGGRTDAKSSGGSISVRFAAGNGDGGTLSTSGGTVTAYVDPSVALDIDASTSGGRVTFDLPVEVRGTVSKRSVQGSMNGGGPTLRMRSSGGSIRLRGN